MNILVVWFADDNFGDNLIRICFEQLLRVVLKNLGKDEDEIHINRMPLKQIDRDLISESDVIYFAGGGLFGLSYLSFFAYLDEITRMAEERNIPVIFSSVGINNMDATEETEHKLVEILERRCIAAVSVRENLELFKSYAKNATFTIEAVADPVTWAKFVYGKVIENIPKQKVVGINVVRGGLFGDNERHWKFAQEIAYLNALKEQLDAAGLSYKFFTNGSFLDNNALKYYAREHQIPAEQVILPNCSRDLVEAVAGFDFVAAIRMHATIVSYALEVPCVNLVWNDKIPFFYQNIGMPDRAIELADLQVEEIVSRIQKEDGSFAHDKNYLMTLYDYLYRVTANVIEADGTDREKYDFAQICKILEETEDVRQNDAYDFRLKLDKGQEMYLARFTEVKELKKEIKNLKKKLEKRTKELERLNALFVVRAYKWLRRRLGPKTG